MEYSALRLETLAFHVVLRAGLATDTINPTAKMEVAAWNQLKGAYKVVEIEVEVLTSKGVEATDSQWEFGSTSSFRNYPEPHQAYIIQLGNYCSPKCVQMGWCRCFGEMLKVRLNGAILLDISLAEDFSYFDNYYDLPSPSLVLSQEAFEVGRLRVSNFVSWMRPMWGGTEEELVVSEERNTFTGCKEGLVWECKVSFI